MGPIPQQLITSFMELGLLESEAKIYSALVLFHDAHVKELQEFLSLSKPSIYEGLRTLEDRGFIILINDKPTTYQAIPPRIVLDMLMEIHINAKENALKYISILEKEKFADDSPPNLWYIFGPKSFESKIKDMLENAKDSVICLTSDKYIDLIDRRAKTDLKFKLAIVTEDPDVEKRLEHHLINGESSIRTVDKKRAVDLMARYKAGFEEDMIPAVSDTLNMFDFDNLFILIIDDSEVLYIPPIPDASVNAMVSKNKAFIRMMMLMLPVLLPKD